LAAALLAVSAVRIAKRREKRSKDCFSAYDGKPLLRFLPNSSDDSMAFADKMEELECVEAGSLRGSQMLAICSTMEIDEVKRLYGERVEVLENDAGEFYRNSSGPALDFPEPHGGASARLSKSWYTQWRTFAARTKKVEDAVTNSAGAATLSQIGTSVEGRPIMVVRLRGAGWTPGAPRVVISCELHAREWITGMACVYAVEKVTEMAKADPSWLAGIELSIIPMANPDGVIYSETTNRMWRKNRAQNGGNRCKGVDLNRNWGPDWRGRYGASGSKCSDAFYGSSAFSEPETQAVKRLIDEAPVKVHLDIHSYGAMILRPWGYTWDDHPRRAEIDVLGNLMGDAITAKHGQRYEYGGNELLGPASGVCPDYSTSLGAFGYTYELRPSGWGGGGFAPPASQILPTAEENFDGILAAISWTKKA